MHHRGGPWRPASIAFVVLLHAAPAWSTCASTPRLGCATPVGGIAIVKEVSAGRERMKLSFKGLAADIPLSGLGDPVNGSTRYDVCFYDGGGALAGALTVDRAGQTCGTAGKPCWAPIGDKGYRYKDVTASADGVLKLLLFGGVSGHGKLSLKAANSAGKQETSMPTGIAARLENVPLATVQVSASDAGCFGATMTRILRADGATFAAAGPQPLATATTLLPPTTSTTSTSLPTTASTSSSSTTTRPSTTSTSSSSSTTTKPSTTSTSSSSTTTKPPTTSTSSSSSTTTKPSTTSTSSSSSTSTKPPTTSSTSSTTKPSTTSTSSSSSTSTSHSTTSTTTKPSTTSTSTSSTTSTTAPNQAPHANAGPDQASQTLVVLSFSGSASFDSDGTIVGYQWAFGDGQGASGVSASHAYATPGTYTVTLTVTDDRGATNSDTATVTAVNRPPVAAAGPDKSATQGTSVAFSGAGSSDPDGTIVGYAWTFGDGGTGSGIAPSHTYAAAGTYTATLTVTDDKGASASDSLVVTVGAASTTWARRIGASSTDTAVAVAVDTAGNVVVAGTMRGTVDFGGASKTSAGGSDWFVAKYTATNVLVWARLMGGTSDDTLTDVSIDRATGDVIALGRISGTASLGGSPLVASGASDIAIGRYDAATGNHEWSRRFGGTIDDSGDAVTVDASGNVLLTGYFRGTIDFGTGPMSVPFDTDLDVFVAKLDGAGATQWAKHFTNTGNDRGYGIAADATGNIAVTGTFSNAIDFGGGTMTSGSGMLDIFLVKLSPTGAHVWSRQIGAPDGSEGGNAVAFDGSGNVVLLAYAVKPIDAGGGTLDALGGADVVVAKYLAATGAHSWSRRLGGTGNDYGYGLSVDGTGNVFVGGSCDAPASFGGATLTPLGVDDAVVAKFGPTGTPVWSRIFGGTSPEIVQDVTIAPNGNPIAAGYFYGSGTYGGIPLTSAGLSDGFVVSLAP